MWIEQNTSNQIKNSKLLKKTPKTQGFDEPTSCSFQTTPTTMTTIKTNNNLFSFNRLKCNSSKVWNLITFIIKGQILLVDMESSSYCKYLASMIIFCLICKSVKMENSISVNWFIKRKMAYINSENKRRG